LAAVMDTVMVGDWLSKGEWDADTHAELELE
jgi:hypothetical protein